MTAFQAFAPIPQETTINGSAGRLVLASDDEKILISGDIEIAANETGLAAALHLRGMLNAVIDNISGRTSGNLSIEPPVSPIKKKNPFRSEEHPSELQSLMRISYAVFCLKKKKKMITTE